MSELVFVPLADVLEEGTNCAILHDARQIQMPHLTQRCCDPSRSKQLQ
jgi:hypothetical protein